jgi:uncharacterized protein YecT (DUF1311 family)
MNRIAFVGWILLITHLSVGCAKAAVGFDCESASTHLEKLICNYSDLSNFDDRLAEDYAMARRGAGTAKAAEQIRRDQRNWLARRNASCDGPVYPFLVAPKGEDPAIWQCRLALNTLYKQRISTLEMILAAQPSPFRLAMSKDDSVCGSLLEFYRRIGSALLLDREQKWEEVRGELLKSLGFDLAPKAELPASADTSEAYDQVYGGELVAADLFNDGSARLIAISDASEIHSQPRRLGIPSADVFAFPKADDLGTADAAHRFFSKPEVAIVPGDYSPDVPEDLKWHPIETYDYNEDNKQINNLSGISRLFLVRRNNNYYFISREVYINSEILVFSTSKPLRDNITDASGEKILAIAGSRNVCFISPNTADANAERAGK